MKFLTGCLALFALVLTASLAGAADDLPSLLKEDFKRGFSAWKTTDPNAWRVMEPGKGSNRVLELFGKSNYAPPHRSPFNIAILKYHTVGDFELTAKVQTTKESYGHRDMCLFFGYQDPVHFYYVHLGQKADDHANQIFIVNDAPRTKISEKSTDGTPWNDGEWHDVKIIREVESGLIEVYFDDMKTPVMSAHDKTFEWGKVGLGSFDDTGMWDDVELRGIEVKARGAAATPDPKTLKYTKWNPDYQIHNAIALSFDDQGRAYVTGARRRKAQDLAISDRSDWMIDDLKLRSTEDKRELIHRRLSPENGTTEDAKKWVTDYNEDGSHDWRDLKVMSDTIYRIEDTTGDGIADKKIAYATGIQTEITGSMAGVLFHDGDVYATASPELMKFRDTDGDGVADEQESIAHGFGVHIAYAGHYMHGLNVGPDGRIYWSIGDKGLNVTSKEGVQYEFPHEGSMVRCEPDGSNFEVFCRGQRNLQEPRFDAYGNWFGVDNDGDSAGEMERLVYIAQHMDMGWRINWQYFKGDYNFWTGEGMFKPYFDGQPGHIVPAIANYVNGPSGFAWNPGTALSPDYKNYFFITQFSSGFQNAFQVKPKGASFEMINDHIIGNGIPLVGLNWGPDGGLYGTDWGGGYPLNDEGGVWKIDVPEYANSKERKETAKLIREGMGDREDSQLIALCDHADQRVRLAAQFELVKLNQQELLAKTALDTEAAQMARIHALWGWAQLERRKGGRSGDAILNLAEDKDDEIRAQFTRTIGDMGALKGDATTDALIALLGDSNDRVRSFAALSLGNLKAEKAYPSLLSFAASLQRHQTYLRHGAVFALSQCASPDQLTKLSARKNASVRHVALLALRRQQNEGAAAFLTDSEEYIATDAARAIHDDDSIDPAMPALAKALVSTKFKNEALIRRSINANFRIGDPESAHHLASYAAAKSNPMELRLDALDALSEWAAPPEIDRIEGRYRKLASRDLEKTGAEISDEVSILLVDPETAIQEAAMRMTANLKIHVDGSALLSVVENDQNPTGLRYEALNALASQESSKLPAAVKIALAASESVLRSRGLRLLAGVDPDEATKRAGKILAAASENETTEAQNALATLAEISQAEADAMLEEWANKLAAGKVSPALQLDVITAAQSRADAAPAIQAALSEFEKTRDPENLVSNYFECLEGGDATSGQDLFLNHIAAQCVRCHKFKDGTGSTIGPNLKSIGAQQDHYYILESLINPQATIAPGYGTISLTLKNGDSVAGQFRKETETEIEVRDADNKSILVPIKDIKSRSPVISTMPPMFALLSKHEIRDLVAYLTTLRAK